MSASLRHRSRASGFTLITAPGWYALDLDPGTSHQSIRDLVADCVPEGAGAADLRRELASLLDGVAASARDQGASLCVLYADLVGDLFVRASMIAVQVPADERIRLDGGIDVVALRAIVGRDVPAADGETVIVDLPAGRAVRVHRRQRIVLAGRTVDADNVQYYVPAPDAEAILLVTFSTPTLAVAAGLREIFDAMTATLAWES